MSEFAALMVLVAATLWGSSGLFVNVLTAAGLTGIQMTTVRLCVVFAVTLLLILFTDREKLRIAPRDLIWFALNGLAGIFLFSLCYTYTIQLTSMATAAVLLYLMPSIVMLYCVLVKHEPFTARKGFCLLLSFAGCALVSGAGSGMAISAQGLVFGLISAVLYASYSLLVSGPLRQYHPLTCTLYTFLFAAVFALTYAIPFGDMAGAMRIFAAQPQMLAVNLLLGVLCSTVTYLLYSTALQYMPASSASILATFEPVAAALLGFLLLHEPLTAFSLAGIACELAALILLRLPQHTSKKA